MGKLIVSMLFGLVLLGADGKVSALANADPTYRELRLAAPQQTFPAENLVLKRDSAVFTLKSGTITFLAGVLNRPSAAVFHGSGEFTFLARVPVEANHVKLLSGKEAVSDSFGEALFVFTDSTYTEIAKQIKPATAAEPRAAAIVKDFRDRLRNRMERPRGMAEAMAMSESMENLEAEVLMHLLNPRREGFFTAFLNAKANGDFRFYLRPYGAILGIQSPEEVGVVKVGAADNQGIWYLGHRLKELEEGTANSHEDKRAIIAKSYKIDTTLPGNDQLSAAAEFTFEANLAGERMVKFGLLPELRVSKVTMGGAELSYIQEDRRADGSFYALLPEAMVKGKTYTLTIEYSGEKVVEKAGGGNFYVGARTSWYPSVNDFHDRAHFDLTFRVPKRYSLVSVGKLEREWAEDKTACTRWVSDVPLAVAGFNFGEFRRKQARVDAPAYEITGWAATQAPDYLRSMERDESMGSITPARLLDRAMEETQASLRLFSDWFGAPPYQRIAITQQPDFNFGQSWPGLVYLPLSAFLDSTQRYRLAGGIDSGMNSFVDEVTPHEVAHQWWGHMVGWATYRDQWLSEGIAEFSAALFLQAARPKEYAQFWQRARERLMQKRTYGVAPNDVAPIWMGLRAINYKVPSAHSDLAYRKGAYVMHMLRGMMWDPKTGDADFKKMMHEFVAAHLHRNASTESFLVVLDKHMKPSMDLARTNSMSWFIQQWILTTDAPRYTFKYTLEAAGGSETLLKATLTQSEVSDQFLAAVPIYVELDNGRKGRLGSITMLGNSTNDKLSVKLPYKPKRVLINADHDVLERM